jgi:FkbM family methyltransferase
MHDLKSKYYKKLYNFTDRFFQNTFSKEICEIINKVKSNKKINVFDIGCYLGNFSRDIKKNLNKNKLNKVNFILFDPNPFIKLKDFNHHRLGINDKSTKKSFYFNSFFPSSGSGFNKITMNDFFWNLSRKLITFQILKKFIKFQVKTISLDNFCEKKKITRIELLKIDTEGHEFQVLKGGKKILNKTKIVLVEVMGKKNIFLKKFGKINNFLIKYNFKLLKIKNIWSVSVLSNIKAVDALYINKSLI